MTRFKLEHRRRCEVPCGMCERKIPHGREEFRVQRGSTTLVRFTVILDLITFSESGLRNGGPSLGQTGHGALRVYAVTASRKRAPSQRLQSPTVDSAESSRGGRNAVMTTEADCVEGPSQCSSTVATTD